MKKRWTAVLALLLSALLLCGCAGADAALDTLFGQAGERDAARELCRFEDMPYERPDSEAFAALAGFSATLFCTDFLSFIVLV